MSGRSISLSICLVLISAGAIACRPVIATADAAAEVEGQFDGVWRSRGYGWLWRISDGTVQRFDIGESFCIPKSSYAADTGIGHSWAELSDDRQTLRLRLQDPDYVYTFDRLAELPALCRQEVSTTPEVVFDVAVNMFQTHYAFFEERDVNWENVVAAAKSELPPSPDEAELLGALEELLVPLRDSHVYIEADIDGEDASIYGSDERRPIQSQGRPAIDGSWNPDAAVASLKSPRSRGDDTLLYGRFGDDIGYLQVNSMEGMRTARLEDALDKAMTAFKGARAVIVDVSENGGGFDSFARLIARRFAAVPTVAYSKHAGDFAGASPQEIVLQPPERSRFVGPVYLITSRDTASAAEVFAIAMRALPNVVHLGETTDGSLSDELWKTLPNGWTLSLSNEVYLDSEGVLWEGRGIPPEIPLEISDSHHVSRAGERAVVKLLEFIRKRL